MSKDMKSEYGSTANQEGYPNGLQADTLRGKSQKTYKTEIDSISTYQDHGTTSTIDSLLFDYTRSYERSQSKESDDEEGELTLRQFSIKISLYINVIILITKVYAYARTFSLSVLAALIDSFLDVVSQKVMEHAEHHSSKVKRSSALYPAGASRLEPLSVLTCAALMGMASFEVMKESIEDLCFTQGSGLKLHENRNMASFWGMIMIVVVKIALLLLCQKAQNKHGKYLHDATVEALAQDHLNDILSNAIAAIALLLSMSSPSLWWVDPVGAILISFYIIHSWYTTGKEQIEQLTGKVAPVEFIDELFEIAKNFDERMEVDVCRAYHFGPKFLVELEVVLPKDTLLFESHDLGMELQYEIEGKEEVERCFVHIDYETRPYDEHVVSKVPELRERIIGKAKREQCCHSV